MSGSVVRECKVTRLPTSQHHIVVVDDDDADDDDADDDVTRCT